MAASITDDIPAMIGAAYDEADRRDPYQTRQRIFLVDGNKQQITAISDQARERGLKVPVFIDFIHVSGYLGKAAAALHPGDPLAAGQWADGQRLRVLHGRAKAVAATLASVAAKTRAKASTRHLDPTDIDKAVTYLANNHMYMHYDQALASGWPIATGMIEGACRFVIEDRFGITGARWSPDGAEVILKIRAMVVNGDLDDYMNYYKARYRNDIHLTLATTSPTSDLSRPHCMTETSRNDTPPREDPQPPPVAVLILDVLEHLPAGLVGVHTPGLGGPCAAIASAHGAISGAICFSAPHKVPAATSNPSAASAWTIRCTGRPSTCFSYASRARNPAVNRPFGTGLAAGGAQTVAGPG